MGLPSPEWLDLRTCRQYIQQLWFSKPWNPSHPWVGFLWLSCANLKFAHHWLLNLLAIMGWVDSIIISHFHPCSYYRKIPASACFIIILSRVLFTISLVITHGSPLRFHIPVSLGCLGWNDWYPIPNSQICQLFTAELSIINTFLIPQNHKCNSASSKHLMDGLSISVKGTPSPCKTSHVHSPTARTPRAPCTRFAYSTSSFCTRKHLQSVNSVNPLDAVDALNLTMADHGLFGREVWPGEVQSLRSEIPEGHPPRHPEVEPAGSARQAVV